MILNAAARFDDATQYSFRWNRTLIEQIGGDVTELLEEDCTRANFDKHAEDAELFIFYDHGNEDGLIEQGGLRSMVDASNVGKLAGAEVYTMCCLAAERLGKTAYRMGVKSWWGYTENFSFIPEEEKIYERLSNLGLAIRMTKKIKWQAVVQEVKEAYDVEIEKAQEENKNPWVVITLINDKNALVCWDNENPPTTTCPFRQTAVRMFGIAGHKFTKPMAIALAVFFLSLGIAGHDFAHQVWELKGTVFSVEGGYVGFAGILVSSYVIVREYLRALGRK